MSNPENDEYFNQDEYLVGNSPTGLLYYIRICKICGGLVSESYIPTHINYHKQINTWIKASL